MHKLVRDYMRKIGKITDCKRVKAHIQGHVLSFWDA